MNLWRSLAGGLLATGGLLAIGFLGLLSTSSFAQGKTGKSVAAQCIVRSKDWTGAETKEQELSQIKIFSNAAAALQKINPALAEGLTQYANEEAQELTGNKVKKAEKKKEGQAADNIKLLKDAAAALYSFNPPLAEDLTTMANRKAKRMEINKKGKKETEKNCQTKNNTAFQI